MRFQSKHVVVTGGGSGIGRAIAIRMASEGATIALLGRRLNPLQDTLAEVKALGGSGHALSCDIQNQHAVDQAFDEIASTLGPIDYMVANAGIGGANEPGPADRFDTIIQTNVSGTYYTVRAAQRHLRSDSDCRMVLVSSCLARFGVPGYTAYCASKAALLGLTRALSLELAPQILVNAICPGWVDTQMARDGIHGMAQAMGLSYEDAHAQAMSLVPMGRMSKPEEIAGLVAWLCSKDSMGMTGQALDMNGGSWMG